MNSNFRFPSSRSRQFVWSSLLRQWPPIAFQLGKVSSRIHQIRRRCHACSVLTLRAYHVTCGSQSIVLQVRGKTRLRGTVRKIKNFFYPSILREINCGTFWAAKTSHSGTGSFITELNLNSWLNLKKKKKSAKSSFRASRNLFMADFKRPILHQYRCRQEFEWQKNPLLFLLCEATEVNILVAAAPLYHLFS